MNEGVPSNPKDKNTKWNKIPQIAWFTLFILGSVDLISTAGETMIIPAIPDIINEFNITYSDSSWILSSYLIAGAVMTPIASKLSIIFGKKEILLTLMILYVIGTLLAGFAMNFSFLIVARVIQGLGLAMFPLAFSIIQTVFPKESLAIGQGIIIALFSSGSVIGLVVGGYVIDNFGWQIIFFVFVPISILTIILINKKINVPNEKISINENTESINKLTNKKLSKLNLIDFKGTITLALLISSFLIVLSNLEEFDPQQFQLTIIFTIITPISLILFIFFQKEIKIRSFLLESLNRKFFFLQISF
ncbi:MAG: MFS transporter [Nitrososphaeraceae archaeon]